MKQFKLTFLLTVFLSMVEVKAVAYDFVVDNIYYNIIEDGNSMYVGVAGCSSELENINIPSRVYYGGGWLPVKEICKDAFDYIYHKNLQHVTLPTNTLEIIRSGAFRDCEISEISFPSSLKIIESYAFYGTYLRNVYIPATVESIGEYAFENNECLKQFLVDSGNQYYSSVDGLLYDKEQTRLVSFPYGKEGTVHIPSTVKEFYISRYQNNLQFIVNSKTWYELDKGEFPHYIEREYDEDGNVISGPTFVIFDNETPLGPVNGKAIIPEGIERIGNCMFYIDAFYNQTEIYNDLNEVILPNSIKHIGNGSFWNCYGLEKINFPDGLVSIGNSAFYNCRMLSSVTLPSSVINIGNSAFFGCSSLTSITVGFETPLSISSSTFSNRANATLYVPYGSKAAYEAAEYWNEFKEIVEYGVPEIEKYTLEVYGDVGIDLNESHLYDRDGNEYDYIGSGDNEFDEGSYIRISPFVGASLYIQEIIVNGESVGTWTEDNAPTEYVIESLSENTTVEFKTYLRAQWRTLGCVVEGPGKVEMYKNGNLIGTASSPDNYFSDVFECGDIIKLVLVPDAGSTLTQFLGGEYGSDEALGENLLGEITDNAYSFTFNPDDIVNKYGYLMRFFKATFEGPEPSTNNTLSAAAPTILTGKTAPLSLSMANEDDIIMTEFYMQLPEGITIEEDEDGYPKVTLNSERSNNHSLEVSRNSEGLYHFLVFSSRNYALKGHEGELFSMNLVCAEGVAAGTYQATVKNILLSDPNKNEITPSDFTFDVTVMDVAMGDANGDGRINGMDIVEMVDYIMERPSDTFVFAAADLTADQKVNGMDLVELVSLVMAQGAASPQLLTKGKGAQMPHHFDSGLTLTSHDDGSLTLGVEKSDAFILAQMIVEVDGGQLTDVTTDTKHEAVWRQIGENRYAVLAYSTKNRPFAANDELLKLYFANDANSLRVTDVMLASAEREERRFESVAYGSATGINSIGDSEWANGGSVYDLQGRKVMSTLPRKGIYIMNGKKVVRK